jgi:anaerobic carbon-monoxide dehydrogenase iron sulfur subunit
MGKGMKAKMIEVEPDKCRGCRLCEMACSFHHEKEFSAAKSRIRILKDDHWAFDCPLLCMQCVEAPCIETCSMEAIRRNEVTGVVVVDPHNCTGCGDCITACPLHALSLDEEKSTVFKCELCAGDPECVKWCPNGALIVNLTETDSSERKSFLDRATQYIRAAG